MVKWTTATEDLALSSALLLMKLKALSTPIAGTPLCIAGVGPDTNAGLLEATQTGTLLIDGVTIDNFLISQKRGQLRPVKDSTVGLGDATITGGFVKALPGSIIEAEQESNPITGAPASNAGPIGAEYHRYGCRRRAFINTFDQHLTLPPVFQREINLVAFLSPKIAFPSGELTERRPFSRSLAPSDNRAEIRF